MLEQHRQQMPALQNKAYFNYGGQGSMPQTALNAIIQSYQSIQETGPFSGETGRWMMTELAKTRQAIASELGVTPDTITLTENVSAGCNIPLWGLEWQTGDRILMTDCEHPGIIAAVGELSRRFNLQVDICPLMATLNEGNPVEVIDRHLHPNTRLVVLSHILWNTGQVLPLADIVKRCHESSQNSDSRKTRVLVDAAQSVGVLPLNLTEIDVDFYAFTGHKWWCGPEGLGGLYVSLDAAESLHPTFIGWRGIEYNPTTGELVGFKPDGRRFEVATSAYPLLAGLRTAIAFHDRFGTAEDRYRRICELSALLWQNLKDLPNVICLRTAPPEAGLVSFQLDPNLLKSGANHAQLVNFLEKERQAIVRTILNPDCVRACVHYFTTESEIERLIEAVGGFCKGIS